MPVTILQLGSPRHPGEGLRIGTVRRPPRGVPKSQFSKLNYYDVWLPVLSPSQDLVAFALASRDARSWQTFERKFRAEMKQPDPSRTLDLLAALSHQTSFSIGCYCDDETRCHRSMLRKLLAERRADIVRSSRPKIPARTPPGNRVHEEARDRFLSKQEEQAQAMRAFVGAAKGRLSPIDPVNYARSLPRGTRLERLLKPEN